MKTIISEKLGRRIKEIRVSKNLKQCEMADLLEMERSNYTRIECGLQKPSDENLLKITKILDVQLYELFDYEHIKKANDLKSSIIKNIETLTENQLRFIYKTIVNIKQI